MTIIDTLIENIFVLDYIAALLILLLVLILYFKKKINKNTWILYWIGFGIGMLWEIPIGLSRELGFPIAEFVKPRPVLPFPIHSIMHSIWDGGIFLVGIYLVYKFLSSPYFKKVNKNELIIFIIWGQVQSVILEVASLIVGLWNYIPSWWNPSVFEISGHYFTLYPQYVWLFGSIIFYFITLKLNPSET